MAPRWDPTSTKYTAQMLQGGRAPGPTSFGTWTDDQIKQLQQAGVTMGDLQNLGLLGPPGMTTPPGVSGQGPGYSGGTIGGQIVDPSSMQRQQQNATLLRLLVSGDQPNQQQNQPPPTWNQVGQAAGLSPADISQFQTMNRTPADIARQFNVLGPQSAGLSPQQFQFQVPQQVVPTLTGQTVVPTAQAGAQPVKQFQEGGLVSGSWDWTKVMQAAGLSQADVSQFQQQGLTPVQVAQRFGQPAQPPSQGQPQPTSQGQSTTGGTQTAGQQKGPTDASIFGDPRNAMNVLGSAVLGMPTVVNQPPSGQPSSKSGVADVGKPVISQTAPQAGWTWDTLAHAAGSSDAIVPYIRAGFSPTEAGRQMGMGTGVTPGLAGPWLNAPTGSLFSVNQAQQPMSWEKLATTGGFTPNDFSIFQQQGLTPTQVAQKFNIPLGGPTQITPLTAAAQPTATAYNPAGTPFAQAPAAPGLQIPSIATHVSALADAGKALYAHFGGDPDSVSPAHIADFHTILTNKIANYTAGATTGGPGVAALAAAPQATAARKMQSGGFVQGFDDGGTVQDPNAPPEARRKTLTTNPPARGASSAQTSSGSSAPAAPAAASAPNLVSGLASAAQAYASRVGGSGQDLRNTPADPDPDIPYLKAAGMMPGGAGSGQPTANALSGIASGLGQVAKGIASSAPPWQMQSYQQPFGSGVAPAPQVQLQAPPAPGQEQGQGAANQYVAYARSPATYPANPYYT